MPKALIIYNNTFHSQLNGTPSAFILKQSHLYDSQVSLNMDATKMWRKGHPNFSPFQVNDKVIKRVHRSGRSVINKFKERYAGPFIIRKVQSNGLTYEISKEGCQNINKVHHRDLRPWRNLPYYISRHLPVVSDFDSNLESESESDYFVPCVGVSTELSDSSSFSGFSGASSSDVEYVSVDFEDRKCSLRDFDTDSFGGSKTLLHLDVNCQHDSCIASEVPLTDLHCTENVIASSLLHSTPINTCTDVREHFCKCNFSEIFPVLEQTLIVQDELSSQCLEVLLEFSSLVDSSVSVLDRRLDSEGSEMSFMSASSSPVGLHSRSIDVPIEGEHNFSGFVPDIVAAQGVSLLNDMRRLISDSRSCIQSGRTRAQSLQKDLLKRLLSITRNSTASYRDSSVGSVVSEISDFVSELSPRFRTPRRVLRSQGSVPECSFVQKSILEYKRGSK